MEENTPKNRVKLHSQYSYMAKQSLGFVKSSSFEGEVFIPWSILNWELTGPQKFNFRFHGIFEKHEFLVRIGKKFFFNRKEGNFL